MTRDVVIVGVGGVGRALREFIEDVNWGTARWQFRGFLDDAIETQGNNVDGYPVLGPIEWLRERDVDVLVGLGAPESRRLVAEEVRQYDGPAFPSLVHPCAHLAASVSMGDGCIVYPGTCINTSAKLGAFVLVNMNAAIGHDVVLHNYSTLAPGACIGGAVSVGEGADVGIGASCKQGLSLGAHCRVGAGAAVIREVEAGQTVAGVPAKPIS